MHNAKDKRIIVAYNKEKPSAMLSFSMFGSKQLDGGLPNEDIISPFTNTLSISYCPLGVILSLRNKKKSKA